MTNFNEGGVQYVSFQDNIGLGIGGYMPMLAVEQKMRLLAALYEAARLETEHDRLRQFLGVVHHLDGFLMSVERIAEHVDALMKFSLQDQGHPLYPRTCIKKVGFVGSPISPPGLIGISSQAIEIDAETLLLRAVALLDRLSKLAEREMPIGKIRSFFELEPRLKEFLGADVRIEPILEIFSKVNPVFHGTIVSSGSDTSLRNVIAHRMAAPEIMDKGFSLNFVSYDCVLAFDAEILHFPLIGTLRKIAASVPYFVIGMIKVLLSTMPGGSHLKNWSDFYKLVENDFVPTWENPFLHFSALIDQTGQGPLVSTLRWLPGGFQTHQKHLRPEVFTLGRSARRTQG